MGLIRNPIIFSLDVDTREEAKSFLRQIGGDIGAVKLGPRLVYRYGKDFVREVAEICPVFIDNKYFDITSTMVEAVKASFESGATLVTIHALAGLDAMKKLAVLEAELNQIRPFKILAVTVLTSWDQNSYPSSLQPWPVAEHVDQLSDLILRSGLSGVVCSGHELNILKSKNLFKVVPGIRFDEGAVCGQTEDQKRVMTPRFAMDQGASALVIGRPILQAKNPQEIVKKILKDVGT